MTVTDDLDARLDALRKLAKARRLVRRQRILNVALIALGASAMFDLWLIATIWFLSFICVQSQITCGLTLVERPNPTARNVQLAGRWATVTAAIASVVYGAITPFVWFADPVAGPIVALLILSGALIHVAMTAHGVPAVFFANAAPMFGFMIGPMIYLTATGGGLWGATAIQVLFGVAVFALQARAAFLAMSANTASLQAAHKQALANAHAARAATQAKSDFVASVSHELRTPLNGMRGGLALLSRSALNADQTELVNAMQTAAQSQVRLLNDLLDFAKIEAGKLDIDSAPYAPHVLARELMILFGPAAQEKGLAFELDIAPDVPAHVIGDSLRVRQIISNLMSNAIKFTSQGGVRVSIRARRRADGASALCWSVSDTGIGLAPDARDRLFIAFVQGGAEIARNYGGTGLGLAISKRLAHLLQGDIKVQSEPGAGSEFTLETPLLAAPARAAPAAVSPAVPAGGRALIADDHAVSRLVMMRLLEEAGWTVAAANDGHSALKLAAGQRFDLILLDCQMPGMDGVSTAQAIRLGGPNCKTPMALVSADGLSDTPNNLFQARLLKPYEPAALIDLLATLGPFKAVAASVEKVLTSDAQVR